MLVLHRFITKPHTCAYLPDRQSELEYEFVVQMTPGEYEVRMNGGWRKFGAYLFHPVCQGCRECRSIRILADAFTPDRSQRRCLQTNSDLTVRFTNPIPVDDTRIDLYNRYHAGQNIYKGWGEKQKDADDYVDTFLLSPLRTGYEISVWEGDILRAVALTDVTPDVVSGVYHFHDPDESQRKRGLGTFVILQTIELARQLGKPYAYFGYYVAGCGSLNYKARFQPAEIMNDAGVWEPFVKPVL